MTLDRGQSRSPPSRFAGAAQAQVKEVEMLHWWTSGGEAAALNVLKGDLAKEGLCLEGRAGRRRRRRCRP